MPGNAVERAGIPTGVFDQIVHAAAATLASRDTLAAWARVIGPVPVPAPLAGQAMPQLLVCPVSENPEFTPNAESGLVLQVGVVMAWEQPHRILSDLEPGISSVLDEVRRALVDNYYLKDPRLGNRRLVKRFEQYRILRYDALAQRGEMHTLYLLAGFDYRLDVDVNRWEKAPG